MQAYENVHGLSFETLRQALTDSIDGKHLHKILVVPPDITRSHSQAGLITALYYDMLQDVQVDVLPALGTHMPLTRDEQIAMFGGNIPASAYLTHDWRNGVRKIGEVPGDYVKEISEGRLDYDVEVELSGIILDGGYDLVISIGQVVPHEVVGMANYSKNMFVGCGGSSMINKTHYLGAIYGMERLMGRDIGPVRQVFDYAETRFIHNIPLLYVLTVTSTAQQDDIAIGVEPNYAYGKHTALNGLYIGRERAVFEKAVLMSQQMNLDFLDNPLQKVVVYLDPSEFRSTWIGNKAVYRTRMAIADGGELIIIAPGVQQFGEDAAIDKLIRAYGYFGRDRTLEQTAAHEDLRANLSAAAHLIHGSSDGRFNITYAAGKLSKQEVESVGFGYMPLADAMAQYPVDTLKQGWNTVSGEDFYYIPNPALGLWTWKERFNG